MYLMVNRRDFSVMLPAFLAMPTIARSQSDELSQAIAALPQLYSIQIQKGDDLIFSADPRGPGFGHLANIKSCSKSIVALLLGAAIDRGEVPAVSTTLEQAAPRLLTRGVTEGVDAITLEDLVTLRAGLERTSGANYGSWVSSSNWVANALSRPMVAQPGTRMLYSTGSTHVLGAALAEATGMSLLAQARTRLGSALDIDIPAWTRDPQGYYLGGNEMALTPEAMLRIALLARDRGRYGDAQVISQDWMDASLKPYARSPWSGLSYGYGWFLSPSGYMLGRGYGGQIIAAHPEHNLAVAITSDPTRPARSAGYFGDLMRLLDGPVRALA